jgi:hypothetical protein
VGHLVKGASLVGEVISLLEVEIRLLCRSRHDLPSLLPKWTVLPLGCHGTDGRPRIRDADDNQFV